jgi:MoaA/NifB/PqqE/SkfB family radical SAM enzyme
LVRNIAHALHSQPAFLFTEVLLTYRCTQRCRQCNIPDQAAVNPDITFENFMKIIDALDRYGAQGVTISGGEPILHARFPEILAYAAGKHFAHLHVLSTLYGGSALIEKSVRTMLDHGVAITCSFDGFGETADMIRGGKDVSGKVTTALERIDALNKKQRKPVKISINTVISQLNLHEIPEIIAFVESHGWLINLDVYRCSSTNHCDVDDMHIRNLDRLDAVFETAKQSRAVITPHWLLDGYRSYLENNHPKRCPYLDSPAFGSKFFIYPNGDVKVCMGNAVGNLLQQTPAEIIQSDAWQKQMNTFEACSGCWNTCYTPSANLMNYLKPSELINIRRMI